MRNEGYEKHLHNDRDFPFFFHVQTVKIDSLKDTFYHWHESVEMLNCTQGCFYAVINGQKKLLRKGDTVIIDPLSMHATLGAGQGNSYYCLIVDKSFCAAYGLELPSGKSAEVFHDEFTNETFEKIHSELIDAGPEWKTAVTAEILLMLVRLRRKYPPTVKPVLDVADNSGALAQCVTEYLYDNMDSRFSMDAMSESLGFNKYYLCHCFKEATGESIVGYLNRIKCERARRFITSGSCTVSEAAEVSGYSNFSYFSKMYRRVFGHRPSDDRPQKKDHVF